MTPELKARIERVKQFQAEQDAHQARMTALQAILDYSKAYELIDPILAEVVGGNASVSAPRQVAKYGEQILERVTESPLPRPSEFSLANIDYEAVARLPLELEKLAVVAVVAAALYDLPAYNLESRFRKLFEITGGVKPQLHLVADIEAGSPLDETFGLMWDNLVSQPADEAKAARIKEYKEDRLLRALSGQRVESLG